MAQNGPSWHATGEAIDLAGSPRNMMRAFNYFRTNFGSRLAELIYTPGGALNRGRPYTPTGKLAADHYDHIHLAYDLGRPGQGEGLGRFVSTSYGPPWGGIQGTGTTATGVDLKGGPRRYGIAVDPKVLKLGAFRLLRKKGTTRAQRLRWRQELTMLLGEHAQLGEQRRELVAPPESAAGADVTTGGEVGADEGGETEAQRAAREALEALAEQMRRTEEAHREHTAALHGVQGELKRQTDFATAVQSTENFQLKKWVADVISGQIGGYVTTRSFTPGTGQQWRY